MSKDRFFFWRLGNLESKQVECAGIRTFTNSMNPLIGLHQAIHQPS